MPSQQLYRFRSNYYTHCVLVEGKGHQMLGQVGEKIDGVWNRECFDNFLDEVSGVIVAAEIIKFLSNCHDCILELFWQCQQV